MKKKLFTAVIPAFLTLSVSLTLLAGETPTGEFKKLSDRTPSAAVPAETKVEVKIEEGHDLRSVTGTGIEMKVYDHAVAGAINNAVAWGFFDEAKGSAQLTLRKYGQLITAEFKRQEDKSYGGVITSADGESQRTTSVYLAGVDMASKTFKLKINGEEVTVSVSPESISNGHFVNPTYSAVIGGKTVSYRIEVSGCMGYSINMGMIILGAYAH